MAAAVDLPDVNLWVALAMGDHVHHERARRYWVDESAVQIAFCRVTALGLLRLTTNAQAMSGQQLTPPEAWATYLAFRGLAEVVLASESGGCDEELANWVADGRVIPRLWTDAYLAAFARSSGWRLIAFDPDFARFDGLELLTLEE